MPSRLFGLLVGIDDYSGRPLSGCVNDIERFAGFLRQAPRAEPPQVLTLANREATRRALLDSFRRHLGQARAGDVALFYYSGHGSREYAPALYAAEEPGGFSETLVAVDSREPGGLDVADKELAVLIAEVAARDAHVVVILDSCHSGTATRDDDGAVRRYDRGADARYRERPAGSYWFEEAAAVPVGLDGAGGWHLLPPGRHVLLAACEDRQTAREFSDPTGRACGLFSWSLLTAWSRLGRPVTYREWLKPAAAEVFARQPGQTPEGRGELDRLALDGTVASRPVTFHLAARAGAWELDAGFLQGLQPGGELAVFPAGAGDLRDLSARLATVRLAEVGAGRSRIEEGDGHLPAAEGALPTVLTHLPHPPLAVAVEGGEVGGGELGWRIERSPLLRRALLAGLAAIEVREAHDGSWTIGRPGGGRSFPVPAGSRDERIAGTVAALEQIARWETLAALRNPQAQRALWVEMTALAWHPPATPDGEPELVPLAADVATLPYTSAGVPGRFAVRLENRDTVAVYCGLFGLPESFATRRLEARGGERLEPGESITLRHHDGIPASIPADPPDARSHRDLLLLLASEEPVDFALLEQGRLFSAYPHRDRPWRQAPSVLESLLWGVGHRDFDEAPPPLAAYRWAVARQWIVATKG